LESTNPAAPSQTPSPSPFINRLLGVHYPAALSALYQLDLKPTHWWVIDAEEQWQQVPRTEVGELYL